MVINLLLFEDGTDIADVANTANLLLSTHWCWKWGDDFDNFFLFFFIGGDKHPGPTFCLIIPHVDRFLLPELYVCLPFCSSCGIFDWSDQCEGPHPVRKYCYWEIAHIAFSYHSCSSWKTAVYPSFGYFLFSPGAPFCGRVLLGARLKNLSWPGLFLLYSFNFPFYLFMC